MISIPFFKKAPKSFLGIDVGTSSIKIVDLAKRGTTPKLENYGEFKALSFPEKPLRTFFKDTFFLSTQEVSKAIRAVLKEAGIKTREVNFSIPDFCSFFTSFKLPPLTKSELPQAVKYAARSYIPLSLVEVTLDWSIISGAVSDKEKNPIEVLVVAIPNEVINQYREIATLSGLGLKALEAEAFALARALARDETRLISLVDIGARSTIVSILEGEILKSSHSFNISGNEITEVFAKGLNIDYNKAEELKMKYGLIFKDADKIVSQQKIREFLLPFIDLILAEIKKVFRDFYQREGKEVEVVRLAGSSSLMPGLIEYFAERLGKEVLIADPFSGFSYPPILEDILKKNGPGYSVAVGLALKGLE